MQGDDGSQDVATSLAAAAAAAAAVAAAAQQQSQPNPCVTQTDSHNQSVVQSLATAAQHQNKADNTPKRLHVSNIPFRFRDPDLRNMFGVSFRINYYILIKKLYRCVPHTSGPENLKKFRPKKLVKSNTKSISQEFFFAQNPFFAVSKMAKNQFLNSEKV